jgi:hypothetical protein
MILQNRSYAIGVAVRIRPTIIIGFVGCSMSSHARSTPDIRTAPSIGAL